MYWLKRNGNISFQNNYMTSTAESQRKSRSANRRTRPLAREVVVEALPPFWQNDSRLLILGSFPSSRSRQAGFYYANPRNRFWQVLASIFAVPLPQDEAAQRELLRRQRIALWDVVASCEISGSSDSSIQAARANDLRPLLAAAPISRICLNGGTAARLYRQQVYPVLQREALCLPSTSAANAAWSLERLVAAWRGIVE